MGKAQEEYVAPTTLDAALEIIDNLRVAVSAAQTEADDLADEVADLQSEISQLEDEAREAANDDETSCLPDETVTDLVKIRHAIRNGTVNDDHLYQLEKLLSELDGGWMCRA